MRYSKKELAILEFISAKIELGHEAVSLDEMVDALAPKLDPDNTQVRFRGGVNASIRNLERKLPLEGLGLYSRGEVGRGNKAIYEVSGDYEKLVNKIKEGACHGSISSSTKSRTAPAMSA